MLSNQRQLGDAAWVQQTWTRTELSMARWIGWAPPQREGSVQLPEIPSDLENYAPRDDDVLAEPLVGHLDAAVASSYAELIRTRSAETDDDVELAGNRTSADTSGGAGLLVGRGQPHSGF